MNTQNTNRGPVGPGVLLVAAAMAADDLDADVVTPLFRSAKDAGETAALTALAGSSCLPADINGELARHPDPGVRTAWFSRGNHSANELSEHLADVNRRGLAALAKKEQRSAVLRAIWVASGRQGDGSVADALANNPHTPGDLLGEIFAAIADRYGDLSHLPRPRSYVITLFGQRRDAHDSFARHLTTASFGKLILHSHTIGNDGFANLVRLFVTGRREQQPHSAIEAVSALLHDTNPDIDRIERLEEVLLEAREAITATVPASDAIHVTIAELLADIRFMVTDPQTANRSWAANQDDHTLAATTSDPELLERLVAQCRRHRDAALAAALLGNPHVNSSAMRAVIHVVGGYSPAGTEALGMLGRTNPAGYAGFMVDEPGWWGLGLNGEPQQLRRCRRELRALLFGDVETYATSGAWQIIVEHEDLSVDDLVSMPWAALRWADRVQLAEVGRWIAGQVGDNSAAWHLVYDLALDTTTTRDIVDLAVAVGRTGQR